MSFTDIEIDQPDSKFLRIAPGEIIQFHILSKEPTKVLNHWINKKKYTCMGQSCDYCTSGNKPKRGYRILVFDRKTKSVKEYEFGSQVAGQIKNIAEILAENQQTVNDIDVRIKREGTGSLDTEYFVNQVPAKEDIPVEVKKLMEVPF